MNYLVVVVVILSFTFFLSAVVMVLTLKPATDMPAVPIPESVNDQAPLNASEPTTE